MPLVETQFLIQLSGARNVLAGEEAVSYSTTMTATLVNKLYAPYRLNWIIRPRRGVQLICSWAPLDMAQARMVLKSAR